MNVLAGQVLEACRARGWMLATAESCTGGMISAALTEIPGSSDVLGFGFVTYSNSAKTKLLGVPIELLDKFGAVSIETAAAMAKGALEASSANLAVSVTGIAGPGGGVPGKPVGTICFAIAGRDHSNGIWSQTWRMQFQGDRQAVRLAGAQFALTQVLAAADEPAR